MLSKKILIVALMFSLGFGTTIAYEEVSCDIDPTFEANSCNQCFDGGNKSAKSNIGFLSDDWINSTDVDMLLYKEEQENPQMVTLDVDNVSISNVPSSENFWEYTDEFNALYSDTEEGYVLPAGDKVTWIKSKLGYGYTIDKNTASASSNIAMLVYPIVTHDVFSNGSITVDNKKHIECVLFKSGEPTKEVVTPATKLPDTGPSQYILLLILAMILGFGILKLTKKA